MWHSFGAICMMHLLIVGLVYLAPFIIGAAVLAVRSRRNFRQAGGRILRLAAFLILLLSTGSLFDGLWSCVIYGQLYTSGDYCCDFIPFFPITHGDVFGDPKGRLIGVSMLQLQLVWGTFAISAWVVTILACRVLTAGFAVCRRYLSG